MKYWLEGLKRGEEIELARSGDRSDGEKRVLGYECSYSTEHLKSR